MRQTGDDGRTAMRRARWILWGMGWLGVAALFVWASVPPSPPAGSLLERLLGPVASLAASAQWVRVDLALRRGDDARAYARAEIALRLDAGDPQGWIFLAHHFLYERASPQREPDPRARASWIGVGFETLERGERASRDPGLLSLERGVALAFLASLPDEDRAWPASASEAWRLSAAAFDRAAAQGRPRAAEAAEKARERARESPARR